MLSQLQQPVDGGGGESGGSSSSGKLIRGLALVLMALLALILG